MNIYIILVFYVLSIGIVLKVVNNKKNKLLFIIMVLIPLIFLGVFRSDLVGVDTGSYIELFNEISMSNNFFYGRYEIGYVLYNKLIACFTTDPWVVISLNSTIAAMLYLIFIYKNSLNIVYSTFLLLTLTYWQLAFNVQRGSIAIGIIFCGLQFLNNQKWIKWTTTVIIASLFHYAVLIFIPVYFLQFINLTWKRVLIILCGFVLAKETFTILKSVLANFLPEYYRWYLVAPNSDEGNGRIFIIGICILGYGLLRIHEVKKRFADFNIMFWIPLITCGFYLLSSELYVLIRIAQIFEIYFIIFIPRIIEAQKNAYGRTIEYIAIAACCFAYYIFSGVTFGISGTVPYMFR